MPLMTAQEKLNLPVLALRQVVIFPGLTIPIAAGRTPTLRAIEAAANTPERLVFAVLQRKDGEEITPGGLYTIGTVAHIDQLQRGITGAQLVLSGQRRGIALRFKEEDGYFIATVGAAEELEPPEPDELAFVALHREARTRVSELAEKSGLPKEVVQKVLSSVDEPGRFADLVSGYLEISADERQVLLETLSVEERLRKVLTLVQRQISVLEAQEDIKTQVQEELGDRQREMFLREQLKAIQRELGDEGDGNEVAELRKKIEALELPDEVRQEVERELGRLERMGRESMESQVIRTFVETIAELPWSERSEEELDLKRASRILDEDHYGLADVKDRVLEFLAVRLLHQERGANAPESTNGEGAAGSAEAEAESEQAPASPATGTSNGKEPKPAPERGARTARGPILLFVGPPGTGKTSIAKSIARSMGREYVRVSLGGIRDEADIRGHRRTYVAAMPGRIIKGMKQAGTKNPVFLLDEVDKLGASFHGDPAAALLEVLDPAQNHSFTDHYLGVPYDLSEVLFIATANFLQNIPVPLLDRMEVVEFAGYTEQEKQAIARQYLIPRQLEEGGVDANQLEITDEALSSLISGYTREAGVRQLERELGRLIRKVARRVAEREDRNVEPPHFALSAEDVRELLGRPKVHPERAADRDQLGIATGMYYTPVGGDIMFVEASVMPGKGELTLTGQLGDVMKESARAAWTYARSHAEALHISEESFQRDVHIHVPAGAIPKDGPSAGVTMATALVSVLSGRPVRPDIAMTGEITLSGRVLPIGGVKEKVLGAVRAGITRIVIPKENEPDLEDLPKDVLARLEVTAVDELGEVLAVALRDVVYREGKLLFEGDDPHTIRRLSFH